MSFQSILAPLWFTPKLLRMRVSSRRAGFCPRLEPLEDRNVPTTFTVLNLADDGAVTWSEVPDPSAADQPTQAQVEGATQFLGAEGIWYHDGSIYFTTKGDNRVWSYQTDAARLTVVYDDDRSPSPILRGVDNVTSSASGDVLVAEDGGDMQVVALTPGGDVVPIVQVVGHPASEVTGPAFDPSGRRLYFSSQRGASGSLVTGGVTYEISGPFYG